MLKVRNIGGEMVGKGNYWNFSTGERVSIEDRAVLPGGASETYYKVPPIAILAAGPVLGLIYAAFLPFIGIAMLIKVVGERTFGGVIDTVWKGATFSWRPSEAYLGGRRRRPEKAINREGEGRKNP